MLNSGRRISFNQATFAPELPFQTFLEAVSKCGAKGVGIWTQRLGGLSPRQAGSAIRNLGLNVSGVNRGGFFTGATAADRQAALDNTMKQIEVTVELGAEMLVVVPGGLALDNRNIDTARGQVRDGLAAVVGFAEEAGIKLAIEPFHPALSAARGVVNTLDLALDLCDEFEGKLGVVTDIFHIWWDPHVYASIKRAGARIWGHHLCDWKLDTADLFFDRALMGDGIADVPRLTAAVMATGYDGFMEIEVMSRSGLWSMDPELITTLCMERALTSLEGAEILNKAAQMPLN